MAKGRINNIIDTDNGRIMIEVDNLNATNESVVKAATSGSEPDHHLHRVPISL